MDNVQSQGLTPSEGGFIEYIRVCQKGSRYRIEDKDKP